jgi:hypothetical protein
MVNLTIDGKSVEVPEGTTVLRAAEMAGIDLAVVEMQGEAAERLHLFGPVGSWRFPQQAARYLRGQALGRCERGPGKAREQRRWLVVGPEPAHLRDHPFSGLSLAPGAGLDLDVGAKTELKQQGQGLGQGGDAFAGKARVEPAASIQLGERLCIQIAHPATPIGGALEPVIMDDKRHTLTRQLDVKLDPATAAARRFAQGRERVLGCPRGSTAVGDHGRIEQER